MKLLSLWEPWATLMALGAKRIDTRSWGTSYRGWLAIQASKGGLNRECLAETCCDEYFYQALREYPPFAEQVEATVRRKGWISEVFPHGKIVAVVYLMGCARTEWITKPVGVEVIGSELMTPQERAFGDFSDGRYGWVTEKLFRLPEPIPFKAKQGLVSVPAEVVQEIRGQWPGAPR